VENLFKVRGMKRFAKSLLVAVVVLAAVSFGCPALLAADASPSASPAAKTVHKYPFHGKLKAVNVAGMTFTLSGTSGRVFIVTPETKIKKNGQTATLNDAVVGDDTGGYAMKSADGTVTALSVRFGPRPGARKKASPSATASPSM
jgi:hypothetical protein